MKEEPNMYAVIPSKIMRDKRLKLGARLLYGEITSLSNQKGYCWASNEYFADLYDCSKRTITDWITELKTCEYISVEMIYRENTKNIDKRIIKLLSYHEKIVVTPMAENLHTLWQKTSIPYGEKSPYPMEENLRDNILIEYSNIISNTGEKEKVFEISNPASKYQNEISELNSFFSEGAKNSEGLPAKKENDTKVGKDKKVVTVVQKKPKFQVPTLLEISEFLVTYFAQEAMAYNVKETANAYYNHFQGIGWVVGKAKAPMKDWQATLRGWVGRIKDFVPANKVNTPQTSKNVYNGVLTE